MPFIRLYDDGIFVSPKSMNNGENINSDNHFYLIIFINIKGDSIHTNLYYITVLLAYTTTFSLTTYTNRIMIKPIPNFPQTRSTIIGYN